MEQLISEESGQLSEAELRAKEEKKKDQKLLQKERVRVSFERLQLAWIRTSVTLLVVGVGAYQYFYQRVESGRSGFTNAITGADFGILLVFLSFVVLLFATFQHIKSMAKLKANFPEMRYSLGTILAYFILAISFSICLLVWFDL
jgi:uncharacterized membrane protein YidH (DUF202 family)